MSHYKCPVPGCQAEWEGDDFVAGSDVAVTLDGRFLDHVNANHPSVIPQLVDTLQRLRTWRDGGVNPDTGKRDPKLAGEAMARIATNSVSVPGTKPEPKYIGPHTHDWDREQVIAGLELWRCTICEHQGLHVVNARVASHELRARIPGMG